jgi:hypothetical protein
VTTDWVFRSVDSSRQTWEDRVNASFGKIKSPERVCYHADCTVTIKNGAYHTGCDYCPARVVSIQGPVVPAPWYFHDPEPLMI